MTWPDLSLEVVLLRTVRVEGIHLDDPRRPVLEHPGVRFNLPSVVELLLRNLALTDCVQMSSPVNRDRHVDRIGEDSTVDGDPRNFSYFLHIARSKSSGQPLFTPVVVLYYYFGHFRPVVVHSHMRMPPLL